MKIIRKEKEQVTYQYASEGAIVTKTVAYWDRASFFIDEPVSDDIIEDLNEILNDVKNSFDGYRFTVDQKKHSFFYSPWHMTEDKHLGFSIILSIDDEEIEPIAGDLLDEIADKYLTTIQRFLDQL